MKEEEAKRSAWKKKEEGEGRTHLDRHGDEREEAASISRRQCRERTDMRGDKDIVPVEEVR
jgi:hypothetical protein